MIIIFLLAISLCIGVMLRRFSIVRHIGQTATWTVWLLIFVFGISLGSNDSIVSDFAGFGLSALIIALAGVGGSVLSVWLISGYIDRNKGR